MGMKRDRLWTVPILAGAVVFMAGLLVGAWMTDRVQGALVDAYTEGQQKEHYAQNLGICRARVAVLKRYVPADTVHLTETAYTEVVR